MTGRASSTPVDRFVAATGGRVFVREWPAGRPDARSAIILLHDSLGCVETWREFPAALAEATGRRVIAYDRLGFGRSAPRDERPALDFIAAEAAGTFADVVAGCGIERFIAFGHSVGGGMAVHCAARFAGDCVALITESAQAFVEDRTLAGIRAAQQVFAEPGQIERLARYHGDRARWVLDAWLGTWLDPRFAGWSLADVLPRVSCPSLVIHGAEDEYGSPAQPEAIRVGLGGPVRLELMNATRHLPHRERPAEVVAMVADFLRPVA